jgi:hypothetical protein
VKQFIKSSAKVSPDPDYYERKLRQAEARGDAAKAEWARSRIGAAVTVRDGLDRLDCVEFTEAVGDVPAGTYGIIVELIAVQPPTRRLYAVTLSKDPNRTLDVPARVLKKRY